MTVPTSPEKAPLALSLADKIEDLLARKVAPEQVFAQLKGHGYGIVVNFSRDPCTILICGIRAYGTTGLHDMLPNWVAAARRKAGATPSFEARALPLIDLSVIIVHRTPNAVLVKDAEDAKPVWLPLSQCEVEGEAGAIGTLTCPEWLAAEKGLV